jgi:NADH:ubiquinone oxidoreductase subunit 5 (subunit L)/multisubunit Na+/H+ antiporter MnhA subunit
MPVTYGSFLIASLSISGIPPFNGFISKWLIYQGLIEKVAAQGSPIGSSIAAICLAIAMFGSGLTLASFMKLLHAMFLGQGKGEGREVPWTMRIPVIVLAGICILFGVFAFAAPLKYLIFPIVSAHAPVAKPSLSGLWSPGLAVLLLAIGFVLGYAVFKAGGAGAFTRRDTAYTGSEIPELSEENRVTGTEFYNSVKEVPLVARFYKRAEAGAIDIYEQGKRIFSVSRMLQYLHNGVLPTYMAWMLLGMIGLFLVFLR